MLMTRFIWQTVLKPLSVTDAKNGANTPSLIPTMEAGHYSIQVGAVNMERYNQRQRRSHLRDYLLTLAEIHGLVTVFVSSHGVCI